MEYFDDWHKEMQACSCSYILPARFPLIISRERTPWELVTCPHGIWCRPGLQFLCPQGFWGQDGWGWLPGESSSERRRIRHGVLVIGNVSAPSLFVAGNRQLPEREADVLRLRQGPHLRFDGWLVLRLWGGMGGLTCLIWSFSWY